MQPGIRDLSQPQLYELGTSLNRHVQLGNGRNCSPFKEAHGVRNRRASTSPVDHAYLIGLPSLFKTRHLDLENGWGAVGSCSSSLLPSSGRVGSSREMAG